MLMVDMIMILLFVGGIIFVYKISYTRDIPRLPASHKQKHTDEESIR